MSGISKPERQWRERFADPEVAARVAEVAGLYLDKPERLLALGVTRRVENGRQPPPTLPLELGVPDFLDELDKAVALPGRQHRGAGKAAHRSFLTRVNRVVPQDMDVYLICIGCPACWTLITRPWVDRNRRFFATYGGTEQSWADTVLDCLGHRAARRLRGHTEQIRVALRTWLSSHAHEENAFAWVYGGQAYPLSALPLQNLSGQSHRSG